MPPPVPSRTRIRRFRTPWPAPGATPTRDGWPRQSDAPGRRSGTLSLSRAPPARRRRRHRRAVPARRRAGRDPPLMRLPQQIDRYRVRERLGQGGMGALFLALDPAIDRLVAIKVLRVDNPDVRERFQREARLAARLQHPNIVTVYDVGEHEGQPFIAMEYIPGETLAELIRRRAPLDTRQRVEMVIEICSGLAFAHKHGIVHRDIKPANLIVSRDSNILKILDFGIARAGESGLTQVGMVIGTPNYMSPEQVRGDTIDHRSDIFAVGLVLYELLVFRQAFEAETQPAVLMKILSDQPPPLASLDPMVDASVAQVVYKALAKNSADRYQDLGAMKADL